MTVTQVLRYNLPVYPLLLPQESECRFYSTAYVSFSVSCFVRFFVFVLILNSIKCASSVKPMYVPYLLLPVGFQESSSRVKRLSSASRGVDRDRCAHSGRTESRDRDRRTGRSLSKVGPHSGPPGSSHNQPIRLDTIS
jgi:hypothetical protein